MKTLLYSCVGAALSIGLACAQTTPQTPPPRPDVTTPRLPAQVAPNHAGIAAASGDSNQAVATTHQSAEVPAKGANSFTEGEARHRMEAKGYSNISGLSKDPNGIWVGHAQKNGKTTTVWLDYKGNVGEHM